MVYGWSGDGLWASQRTKLQIHVVADKLPKPLLQYSILIYSLEHVPPQHYSTTGALGI